MVRRGESQSSFEAGPVGFPHLGACCQPGFFRAGCSAPGEGQVTGGLCLGSSPGLQPPPLACVASIPMVTPLVKMLELVFMLADTEKKQSRAQTEFFSRKNSGRAAGS